MAAREWVFGVGTAAVAFVLLFASCGDSSNVADDAGFDAAGTDGAFGSDAPASGTDSGSTTIGPSGGTIHGDGVAIDVPAGALTSAVTISITRESSPPPGIYIALSSLYRFAPEGLTFAIPATVTFDVAAPNANADVQWSNPISGGYDALSTTWSGNLASARVSHFSSGFVGSGATLVPSNLAADTCDTLATSDLDVTTSQTIDTGLDANCDLIVTGTTPEICVILRNNITIDTNVVLTGSGTRALAFVGTTSVMINGTVDVSAAYAQSGAGAPDPDGEGETNWGELIFSGAGGGYGTLGGAAGNGQGGGSCNGGCATILTFPDGGTPLAGLPGATYGLPTCVPLVGGASGASYEVTADDAGVGGGGGGALEIVSCGSLAVGAQGKILAGGGGGIGGNGGTGSGLGGGGGGSGGTILLEGASVALSAGATVIGNGGGGGSGGAHGNTVGNIGGNAGSNGSLSAGPASGGPSPGGNPPGPPGANGGAESVLPTSGSGYGGGGGAVGRVRINVPASTSPSVSGAVFSPLYTTGPTSMH